MIIKFNDKVLKVGNKWVANGFPVLNGNYLVSSSVNAVSAIPTGYGNYYYYVPIPENMGEPVVLPDTYVAYAQEQCTFLYNNQRSFINPYPGETFVPTVQFLAAS